MPFFHVGLNKIEKELKKPHKDFSIRTAVRIIDEHINNINEEFKIESKIHWSLLEYYGHLKEAKKIIVSIDRRMDTSPERDKAMVQIRMASQLVREIERWITAENAEHKFLK